MERKSAKELIKRILKSVSDSPKSIHEIAKDCDSNWESVKIYLEALKEAGVLEENLIGNKRVFSIPSCNIASNSGNYFDLPITQKDEKQISSLYAKIKELWKKETGKFPGKTQVQKSLFKINKICKLNLPIGWYLFGTICVKPYDPLLSYDYTDLGDEIIDCAKEVVSEYSKESSVYALKLRQYREENKVLYQTKEYILALFSSSTFSESYIQEITSKFYTLVENLPKIFDDSSRRLVNDFVGTVIQMLNLLPDDEMMLVKNDVHQAFNEVWKLIALYEYYSDLEPYYIENFSKELELKHFLLDMNLQKLEVIEHLSYLNDLIPTESEPDDEAYKKLNSIFSSFSELNETEKKQKEKELEMIENEKGEDAAQDFLIKKFGLD